MTDPRRVVYRRTPPLTSAPASSFSPSGADPWLPWAGAIELAPTGAVA